MNNCKMIAVVLAPKRGAGLRFWVRSGLGLGHFERLKLKNTAWQKHIYRTACANNVVREKPEPAQLGFASFLEVFPKLGTVKTTRKAAFARAAKGKTAAPAPDKQQKSTPKTRQLSALHCVLLPKTLSLS